MAFINTDLTVEHSNTDLKKIFPFLMIAAICINALGIFNPILEPDGTLYAAIAKHIAVTNDWINLYANGNDWLDKPHFPFWITALSFKIFGATSFAYKLPSFLFWIAGIFYLYNLSLKIYNENVARLAALIYATSLHVILSNFDVRAEAYLTMLILAATFHSYCVLKSGKFRHIIAAAFFCGCAIMTKGIFTLITIGGGFVLYILMSKQWKELLNLKWWLIILLAFVFTIPELYCLYVQFDLHPEKIVYGQTHVSGIKFFFWDSQFGRFFNNGPIKGSGDLLFFFHTILWAYLPWSLLFYVIIVRLIRKHNSDNKEAWIINGAALISFVMFSLSRFQLPHYILIIIPHFAIINANELTRYSSSKFLKFANTCVAILFIILIILIGAIAIIFKPLNIYALIFAAIITCALVLITNRMNWLTSVSIKAICFALLLSFFMNANFYPTLFQYQSGMIAAKWLNENMPAAKEVFLYKSCSHTSFSFYSNSAVRCVNSIKEIKASVIRPLIIYGPKKEIDSLAYQGLNVKVLNSFTYFHTSKLNIKFINAETRNQQLQKYQLAEIILTGK